MSASKKQAVTAQNRDTELNDEIVREYLKNHDDFLQRNPDMLDYLHISHATGSAVSLVEKQASVLRERNTELRQQLKALNNNARANDALFEQTRTLVLKLLEADSLDSLYSIFMTSLLNDFDVEHACMILYSDDPGAGDWRSEPQESVKREIGALFRGHKAVCGTLRKEELMFLFPDGKGVGSAALAPLAAGDEPLGLIAVGSSDANRYNSKVDTLFLSHIADVMVKLMSRLPGTPESGVADAATAQDSAARFLAYLREVRRLSPHTISSYQRDLASLQRFCEGGGKGAVDALVEADIRAWAAQMHRQGLSGGSIQRSLSAARSFYNFLGRENGRLRNPAASVQAPRKPRKLPKALDPDQVDRYLSFEIDSPVTRRDAAMAELFYSSGLRLAELAAVNIDDIDAQSKLLTVTGKGNKTRTVPVGSAALTAIARWLEVRPPTEDDAQGGGALFTSNRGRRISLRNIQARLKLQARKAGMPQDVHPHMLRHSFASHMLESSGDLRAVQELLGHANISTTQIYTHLDFQHLAKVYDAAHPRAKRRKRD